MIENWKSDLVEEKSLRQVFHKSRVLLASKFNWNTIVSAASICFVVGTYFTIKSDWRTPFEIMKIVVDLGFDLTVQILGFLIGGFAIFATVSDHKLMIMLAKTPYKNGISVFKAIFFNFLSVFFIYVVTLAVSFVLKIAPEAIPLVHPGLFGRYTSNIVALFNSIVASAMFIIVALCILRLKSFIWNIYTAFIVFLQTSEIKDQLESEQNIEGR